jgi:hypothetical protein
MLSLYGTTPQRGLQTERPSSWISLASVRAACIIAYSIVDYIPAYPPSKFRLLALDVLIVFLQMVLATIAHETSLAKDNNNSSDTLLPTPNTILPDRSKSYPPMMATPYVIDLSLRTVISRLQHPLPSPNPVNNGLDGLPLPNTTPWPLPAVRLRMLLGVPPGGPAGRAGSDTGEGNAIPGALDL